MSFFPAFKLTKKGEELLNKINGNLNETLVWTRGEVGSGTITNDDEIRFLTALKEKWGDAPISDIENVTVETGSFTRMELQFFNSGLTETKNLRELGLYAKGNDNIEVLMCYSNAYENYDPIPIPEDNPQAFIINVTHQIATGTKVTAEIPLYSFVTINKLEQALNKLKADIITVITGGKFGGLIQAEGEKKEGYTYIDGNIDEIMLCTETGDWVEPDLTKFKYFSNNYNSTQIEELRKISSSQIQDYGMKIEYDRIGNLCILTINSQTPNTTHGIIQLPQQMQPKYHRGGALTGAHSMGAGETYAGEMYVLPSGTFEFWVDWTGLDNLYTGQIVYIAAN